MALTIHFLIDDFRMRSYSLEVKPVLGKHTGQMIRSEMESSFLKWGLNASKLSILRRDSGSNIVKACNNWGVRHFSCVGHSLFSVLFLWSGRVKSQTLRMIQLLKIISMTIRQL